MRTVRLIALTAAVLSGTSVLALAQEPGKAGITLGFPGAIGVLWHVSDIFAIRPAVTFSHNSTDSPIGSSSGGWATGFNLSALVYIKKYENVRTYVSPQFRYSHTSVSTMPTASSQTYLPTITETSNLTGGAGAFGAQYTPTAHFGVYGEFGLEFSHQKSSFTGTTTFTGSGTSTTWGTFAGVGVIFYP